MGGSEGGTWDNWSSIINKLHLNKREQTWQSVQARKALNGAGGARASHAEVSRGAAPSPTALCRPRGARSAPRLGEPCFLGTLSPAFPATKYLSFRTLFFLPENVSLAQNKAEEALSYQIYLIFWDSVQEILHFLRLFPVYCHFVQGAFFSLFYVLVS